MVTLDKARAALERGEYEVALQLVGTSDDSEPALEIRAESAHAAGRFETALTAWEHLYSLRIDQGRDADAAVAAANLALHLLVDSGLMAPVRGWLARAERLVGREGRTPTHAVIAMVRTYERFLCGDPEGARAHAALAVELGSALGVHEATALGQVATARLLINDGRVDEGIDLLDEIAVTLASGSLPAYPTGMLYCELVCAAQTVGRLDRAREWTDVMERWRHGAAYGGLHGRCRVHRAEMLRVSGPADEAEREALEACAELRPWLRREFGWPLSELGNIRLRRGDLAGAEEAFLRAHEHAWTPQPGLALLRLEQGAVDEAAAMIGDSIEHPSEVPWKERPPFGDLRLAPLLEAQAEIAAARGDAVTARRAADDLTGIAERHESPGLRAAAAVSQARAALVAGAVGEAIDAATAALAAWVDLDAPYDAAAARVVLGEAHVAAGHAPQARMEWQVASTGYARFGAELRHAAVEGLLAGLGEPPSSAKHPRLATEVTVLRRAGDHWQLHFRGTECVLADLKGLRYLERLLAEPGREFHVLDLVMAESVSAGLPVLDDEARDSYRRRLAEVELDLDDATADNDLARLALAERDKEYLVAELGRAVGIGGRARTSGGTVERARTSVTRSLRYALARLEEAMPELGAHLDRGVHTGSYCSYQPDPVAPITWQLR